MLGHDEIKFLFIKIEIDAGRIELVEVTLNLTSSLIRQVHSIFQQAGDENNDKLSTMDLCSQLTGYSPESIVAKTFNW